MTFHRWIPPHFSVLSLCVVVIVLAHTMWSALVASPRRYRELVEARRLGQSDVARRFYRRALTVQVARCAVVGLVIVTDRGVSAGDLGLRAPVVSLEATLGTIAYVAALLVLSTIAVRRRLARGLPIPGQRLFDALIPRPGERGFGLAVAVGAGVSEELLFRGLFFAAAADAFGLNPVLAVLLTSAVFGLGHVYQGHWGVLGTALVGWVLGTLFLTQLSLLVPVVIHVMMDLRALLFLPPAPASAPSDNAEESRG